MKHITSHCIKAFSLTALALMATLSFGASALAQKVIKMSVPEEGKVVRIALTGRTDITAKGLNGTIVSDGKPHYYMATEPEIELQGDVLTLDCSNNTLQTLDISGCTCLQSLNCSNNSIKELSIGKNKPLKELDCSMNLLSELSTKGNRNLVSLNCSNNNIIGYDLSNNGKLEILNCSDNHDISGTNIPQLDISKCTKLKVLDITGCLIPDIDLTNNTELVALYANKNEIISYNLSNCPNLEEFYCEDNGSSKSKLKNLNLSSNTKLRILSCFNNSLEELDVSKNPDLEVLSCSMNDFQKPIDVTNNPKLKEISVSCKVQKKIDLSNNPELESFSSEWGALTSVDFTKNPKLKVIRVGHNFIEKLNLSHNEELEELSCYDNLGLTKLNLSYNKKLKVLLCNGCSLETLDFSECKDLTNIKCYDNMISEENMTALMKSLPEHSFGDAASITIINSDNLKDRTEQNDCTKEDVSIAMAKNWTVIDYNKFANQGKGEIFKGTDADESKESVTLTFNKNVGDQVTFTVYRNGKLSISGVKEPISDIAYPGTYTLTSDKVVINGNVEGLYIEGQALKNIDLSNCSQIRYLDCNNNMIEGTLDLSKCKYLSEIECANNKIEEVKLPESSTLSRLDMRKNKLSSFTINAPALERLYISGNEIKSLDLSASNKLEIIKCDSNMLETLLIKSDKLKAFSCQNNKLSVDQINAIAKALPKSEVMRTAVMIDSKNNDNNKVSIEAVAEALSKNWIILDQFGNEDTMCGVSYEGLNYEGVENIAFDNVKIYPNPVVDYAYIESAQANTLINIYNINGMLVQQVYSNADGYQKLDFTNLEAGTYVIVIGNVSKKIIKK